MTDPRSKYRIETKEYGDSTWKEMKYPPSRDWSQLRLLAERWSFCIRLVDETGLVFREYYGYKGSKGGT